MNFEIKHLYEKNEKKWDEFVKKTEFATFCHQIKWKNIIEDTYRFQNYYLFAENDTGDVVGVLPLFMVKDLFFGRRMVSIPFVPYGGVCCETDAIGKALIDEAITLGNKFNVDYCELRSLRAQECTRNFKKANNYVTSILSLGNTPDTTFQNVRRDKRRSILKSEKNGLEVKYLTEDKNIFPDFFDIYSQNLRRLGTPQHGEEFFKNILKYFPSDIICVYKDDDYHFCALVIFFKNTVIDYISASFIDSRKYFVTDFGVWNLIKKAHELNYTYFDFGRSVINSDNLESKRRWGVNTMNLDYCYPIDQRLNVSKLQPATFGKSAQLWSKLPLTITRFFGPRLRKFIV